MRKATILVVATAAVLVLGALAAFNAAAVGGGKPQTTCPVSGESIDKGVHLDFQGQRIYFCCPKCVAEFKQDPEKYFDKIASAGVTLENIQTTCPVSGEKLGEGDMGEPVELQYKGRTVKLCCKMCVGKFEKDPSKYLANLPGEQPATAK
jgi:YHS domain-containing protein